MPYPFLTKLPIWIQTCELGSIDTSLCLRCDEEQNYIVQIISGHCNVLWHNEKRSMSARSLLFLGRSTHAELVRSAEQECRYVLLALKMVQSAPYLDLNRLCLAAPLVDSFFAQKTRFCVLEDRQYINMALGEIRYEWENGLGEKETALRSTISNLLVRIARCFYSQNCFTGIKYVTDAKKCIYQYFQQPLTVDFIAAEIGISRSYLEALFSRYMRGSIVDYVHAVRCDHAAKLLSTTGFAIIDIAMDSGFNNRQHFARVFREIYGTAPSDYRKLYRNSAGKLPENQLAATRSAL